MADAALSTTCGVCGAEKENKILLIMIELLDLRWARLHIACCFTLHLLALSHIGVENIGNARRTCLEQLGYNYVEIKEEQKEDVVKFIFEGHFARLCSSYQSTSCSSEYCFNMN